MMSEYCVTRGTDEWNRPRKGESPHPANTVFNAPSPSKIRTKALIHKKKWLHETDCPVLRENAKGPAE
jgi:hypothetical protein